MPAEYGLQIRWNNGDRQTLWYKSKRARDDKSRALLRGMLVLSVKSLMRKT